MFPKQRKQDKTHLEYKSDRMLTHPIAIFKTPSVWACIFNDSVLNLPVHFKQKSDWGHLGFLNSRRMTKLLGALAVTSLEINFLHAKILQKVFIQIPSNSNNK